MYTITKSIAIFVTAALALNAMAPALAHAAKHLHGEQVKHLQNALVQNAYAIVTYYENNKPKRKQGQIKAIGETSFTIRSGRLKSETTIAYAQVLSIIMSPEVMTRGQIDPTKIEKGWLAHVIYTSKGKKTTTWRILRKDANSITIGPESSTGVIGAIRNPVGMIENLLRSKKIAYSDIDTLVVAVSQRDIEEWKIFRQVEQLFSSGLQNAKVRFKVPSVRKKRIVGEVKSLHFNTPRARVPSVRKKRIVGEVVKMTRDTLFIREGRTFLEVPLSSISNLEVSLGQHRNTGEGLAIGCLSSFVIAGLLAGLESNSQMTGDSDSGSLGEGLPRADALFINGWSDEGDRGALAGGRMKRTEGFDHLSDVERGAHTLAAGIIFFGYFIEYLLYIGIPLTAATTLIGASIKSDKWVEVPPQRLKLSIAPTSANGLRAALTFNF